MTQKHDRVTLSFDHETIHSFMTQLMCSLFIFQLFLLQVIVHICISCYNRSLEIR